jgi:hypothetical protein
MFETSFTSSSLNSPKSISLAYFAVAIQVHLANHFAPVAVEEGLVLLEDELELVDRDFAAFVLLS